MLEAEWRQVCGEAWVRGQRKISQVLGAFGLLDFTMLRPVLAWRTFWNLWTIYFFNVPNFFWAAVNRGCWIRRYGGPSVLIITCETTCQEVIVSCSLLIHFLLSIKKNCSLLCHILADELWSTLCCPKMGVMGGFKSTSTTGWILTWKRGDIVCCKGKDNLKFLGLGGGDSSILIWG